MIYLSPSDDKIKLKTNSATCICRHLNSSFYVDCQVMEILRIVDSVKKTRKMSEGSHISDNEMQ
jgi:hypothetical protein